MRSNVSCGILDNSIGDSIIGILSEKFIKTFIDYFTQLITSKELLFENVFLFFKGICLL
jgi:hypothetical protein